MHGGEQSWRKDSSFDLNNRTNTELLESTTLNHTRQIHPDYPREMNRTATYVNVLT